MVAERLWRMADSLSEKARRPQTVYNASETPMMGYITEGPCMHCPKPKDKEAGEAGEPNADGDSDGDGDGDEDSSSEWSGTDLSDEEPVNRQEHVPLDEGRLLDWLNGPEVEFAIRNKHRPNMECVELITGLKPGVEPMQHQKHAAAVACYHLRSPLKGVIIADHPGLGKTLSALLAIKAARRTGGAYGPCVVVAPVSCCSQWVNEIKKCFEKDHIKVLRLSREVVAPIELCEYDIVVTTYGHLVSEFGRRAKFEKMMEQYKRDPMVKKEPKRPAVSLLTDVFLNNRDEALGQFLVMDEAHVVKNPRSRTYAAMILVRTMFTACIMLTATPLDNTWVDVLALWTFLDGVPVTSIKQMREAFVGQTHGPEESTKRKNTPRGGFMQRFIRCLDATTLRRPKDIAEIRRLPVTKNVHHFDLPDDQLARSNEEFGKFGKATKRLATNKRNRKMTSKKASKKSKAADKVLRDSGFGALIRAQQVANHPSLVHIMKLENSALIQSAISDDPTGNIEVDEAGRAEAKKWLADLEPNEKWRSARVDFIVDTVDKHNDIYPDHVFVIMDESVYFLDIVRLGLEKNAEPLRCFSYDGRMHPIERDHILHEFSAASGPRVLLASRGTGGLGLNIQAANVLIQCGPWWKVTWENQALGRIDRHGQTRPVFVYEIKARECLVEMHKCAARKAKHFVSSIALSGIERLDAAEIPVFSLLA